jgi:glucosamine--fructose-6-phosphate aminotransferase (isomerizing)
MCGIFGYVGDNHDAAPLVLAGLKRLEYRGYDSWGVAVVPEGKKSSAARLVVKKKAGKIGAATVDDMPNSTLAFGHTRWATHGGVTDTNAHPHLDCKGAVAVIHNGIFENYEAAKKHLAAAGHQFISETDTEVIAHQIEEYLASMPFEKAVQKTFNGMEGLNAIIAINTTSGQMIAARNGSPLVVGFGKGENFLASDAAALLPHTRNVHFMLDEEMAIVEKNRVAFLDAKTGASTHPTPQRLTWTYAQAEKGKFPHFMLKEIHEQPRMIADIATGLSQTMKMANVVRRAKETILVGCGTASYAAIAGGYLFSKIANRKASWAVGSEFGYQLNFLTKDSLVFALSQSGETIDILESVKRAKDKGAQILALVNVLGSSLYRLADHKMLIGVGPEKAVASTKASTGKIAHLTLLAYALAGRGEEGQQVVAKAVAASKLILADTSVSNIQKLADLIKDKKNIFVVGRGLSYPAALETALKIKEISYIHAEGFAAGELKHGVIALIEKGTPCIVFAPNDEAYGANLAGAMELKARGGYIIGVSHKRAEVFDYFLPVADAREATLIPNFIVAQLLAYYLSVKKGLDPDMPRNLAKSVTVK